MLTPKFSHLLGRLVQTATVVRLKLRGEWQAIRSALEAAGHEAGLAPELIAVLDAAKEDRREGRFLPTPEEFVAILTEDATMRAQ